MSFLPSSDHNYVNDEDDTNIATMDVSESGIPIITRLKNVCEAWAQINQAQSPADASYLHALLCTTVKLTLSPLWQTIEENDRLVLHYFLSNINLWACQAFASLLPNPWENEDMFLEVGSERSTHSCGHSCFYTPRNILRTRVEILCYCGFRDLALHLCFVYRQCRNHKNDYFYADKAFNLLFNSGNIKRMVEEMKSMTCHDGVQLIRFILKNEDLSVHPLVECLTQILLVRDLLGPSQYCCTLELMEIWCMLHYGQGTDYEIVVEEAKKLGALALTSAHLYLLVDVLYNQYGKLLLPLYLKLYINALIIDINNLEYARQVDCKMSIQELETSMAGVYTKLSLLLDSGNDSGGARECLLTAFSLEPTVERLNMLENYASTQTSVWRYKRTFVFPCQGECHCTEKGLCRRDLELPPWYLNNVPNGILDSNLPGLSDALLQDLCVVVEGPRCHWLSWNLPWDELRNVCTLYFHSARQLRIGKDDKKVGIESRMKRLGLHEQKDSSQPVNTVNSTLPVMTNPLMMEKQMHLVENHDAKVLPLKIETPPPPSPIEYPVLHIEDQQHKLLDPKLELLDDLLDDLENSQFGASASETNFGPAVPVVSLSTTPVSESKPLSSDIECFLNGKTSQSGFLSSKCNSNRNTKLPVESAITVAKSQDNGKVNSSITSSNPFLYSLLSKNLPSSSFPFSSRMSFKPRSFHRLSNARTSSSHTHSTSSKDEKAAVSSQTNQVLNNVSVDANLNSTTYIIQLGEKECSTQTVFNCQSRQRSSQSLLRDAPLTVNCQNFNQKDVLKINANSLVTGSTSVLTSKTTPLLQIQSSYNSKDVKFPRFFISTNHARTHPHEPKLISLLGDSPESISHCKLSPKEKKAEDNYALNFPRLGDSPPPEHQDEVEKLGIDYNVSAKANEVNAISILSNSFQTIDDAPVFHLSQIPVSVSLPSQNPAIMSTVFTSQSNTLQSSSVVSNTGVIKNAKRKRKGPIIGRAKGKKWESVRGAHGFTGYRIVEDHQVTNDDQLQLEPENKNSKPSVNNFSKLEVVGVSTSIANAIPKDILKFPLVKKCSPAFLNNNPIFNSTTSQTSQVPNIIDSIPKSPISSVPTLKEAKPVSWTHATHTNQLSSNRSLSQNICSSSNVNQIGDNFSFPKAIGIADGNQHNMIDTVINDQIIDNKIVTMLSPEVIKVDLPETVLNNQPVVEKITSTANLLRTVRIAKCRSLKNTFSSTSVETGVSSTVVEFVSSSLQSSNTSILKSHFAKDKLQIKNRQPRRLKKIGLTANKAIVLNRFNKNNVNNAPSQIVTDHQVPGYQPLPTSVVAINKETPNMALNLPIQPNAITGNVVVKFTPTVNGHKNTLICKDVKTSTTDDLVKKSDISKTELKSPLFINNHNTTINNATLAEGILIAKKNFNRKTVLENYAENLNKLKFEKGKSSSGEKTVLDIIDDEFKASSYNVSYEKNNKKKIGKESICKSYKCDVCTKKYVRSSSLARHVQTKHTESKKEELTDKTPSCKLSKLIKVATVKIDPHLTANKSFSIKEESPTAPLIVEHEQESLTQIASAKLSSSINDLPLKNCFVQLVRQDVTFSPETNDNIKESCITSERATEVVEASVLSESHESKEKIKFEELDENKQEVLEELDMICEEENNYVVKFKEEKTVQIETNYDSYENSLANIINADDIKEEKSKQHDDVSKNDVEENRNVQELHVNFKDVKDQNEVISEADVKIAGEDNKSKSGIEDNNLRFEDIDDDKAEISFDINSKENVYYEGEDMLIIEVDPGNTPVLSQKFEEDDEKKRKLDKNESKITISQEMSDIRRGRTSSRTVKPPQKRGCPCCENVTPSPTQSPKKCRVEPSQISKNTLKIIKKARSGAHVNKIHISSSARS